MGHWQRLHGWSFNKPFLKPFQNPIYWCYLPNLAASFTWALTSVECKALSSIPPEQEIQLSLKSMHPNKSPVLEGMTLLFFQKFWIIIKYDLLLTFQHFFRTGNLSTGLNSTIIALILTTIHPTLISNFKPISLSNTLYKIMSKILTLRLNPYLPHFISPYRLAFVQGRIIQEHSILAAKVLHTIKHKRG